MTEKIDPKKLRKWIDAQLKENNETISLFGDSGINSALAKGRNMTLKMLIEAMNKEQFNYGDEE